MQSRYSKSRYKCHILRTEKAHNCWIHKIPFTQCIVRKCAMYFRFRLHITMTDKEYVSFSL